MQMKYLGQWGRRVPDVHHTDKANLTCPCLVPHTIVGCNISGPRFRKQSRGKVKPAVALAFQRHVQSPVTSGAGTDRLGAAVDSALLGRCGAHAMVMLLDDYLHPSFGVCMLPTEHEEHRISHICLMTYGPNVNLRQMPSLQQLLHPTSRRV